MRSIILVAESGSDITPELAARYHIHVVPMHVAFDTEVLNDGEFPVQKICDYYNEAGKLPTTSGCAPEDFVEAFDRIHAAYPEAQILYLAYSAVTTCSYQSAVIAAEGRDYVTAIDTKQVSVGQATVVVEVAKQLEAHPEMSISQAAELATDVISRANMCFLPDNLEFLRAGGRVSNVVCLGSQILSLHPCIEILDGKLIATKKYRGKMEKVAAQLVRDYAEHSMIWIEGASEWYILWGSAMKCAVLWKRLHRNVALRKSNGYRPTASLQRMAALRPLAWRAFPNNHNRKQQAPLCDQGCLVSSYKTVPVLIPF